MRENPNEGELLFHELLIGVTSFFRDPEVWERLKSETLPGLLATCAKDAALRAWVPACSTGEEAYSLGIVFKEAAEQSSPKKNVTLQIFATDLDAGAIEKARQGLYPANIAADVSAERLDRFFVEDAPGYRVRKDIRDLVVFATQNVLHDPPFTRLDLLACRNLLIYLTPEAQEKLIPLFHYSLKPGGILCLGSAETIGGFTDLFAALNGKSRLYRRLEPAMRGLDTWRLPDRGPRASRIRDRVHRRRARGEIRAPLNLQTTVEQYLLKHFAPAAVLASRKGDLLYVSGQTEKYLEVPAGKANWNVFAMARDGLRGALAGAFHKAVRTKSTHAERREGGDRRGDPGRRRHVIEPIEDAAGDARDGDDRLRGRGGADRAAKRRGKGGRARGGAALAELEQELEQTRAGASDDTRRDADLGGGAEEHQRGAAVHQRRAAVDERRADHFEGRDAVDERGAADPQPRAAGEGGRPVAHQQRHEEPPRQHRDRHPLPRRGAERAPLHPAGDHHLQADPGRRRPAAGRPRVESVYPELHDDAREVLRSLVFKEKTVATKDGRRFRVRIMPYRTSDNRIDGVVVTLTNVSEAGAREPNRQSGAR